MNKKILYLPLDERPCNYLLPQNIVSCTEKVELVTPPMQLLGRKKQSADTQQLWEFVEKQMKNCDCAVLSAEMLFFGGLLPSRLHNETEISIQQKIMQLKKLKQDNPKVRLYLFELIMRTPRYNSSEEEPDYYETYGKQIFLRAYLQDKQARQGLTTGEQQQLEMLEKQIPVEYVQDYEHRRTFNRGVLEEVLKLVQDGTIERLYIPQDDSSEFGYTAIDQKYIQKKIAALNVQDRVHLHPGADEAGAELVARAYLDLIKRTPLVYVTYSSTLGAQIVPLYEDRILEASIQQHILACGCVQCDTPDQADLILAVNTPGKKMQESFKQNDPDVTYQSFRCLQAYVQRLMLYMLHGKKVAVADCAYANGGELAFIHEMDQAGVLEQLVSYKGWNTACNTVGTTLAQGIFALEHYDQCQVRKNLMYHLLDDAFYQSAVRGQILKAAEKDGLSYFDLKDKTDEYAHKCEEHLKDKWAEVIQNSFSDFKSKTFSVCFPWNRLFEIGITWNE